LPDTLPRVEEVIPCVTCTAPGAARKQQ
jgi:hypothetical protein